MNAKSIAGKAALLLVVAALVVSVSVLAASCGGTKGTTGSQSSSTSSGASIQVSNIDSYLKQMDASMNGVSPNDFDDKNLSDSELGL